MIIKNIIFLSSFLILIQLADVYGANIAAQHSFHNVNCGITWVELRRAEKHLQENERNIYYDAVTVLKYLRYHGWTDAKIAQHFTSLEEYVHGLLDLGQICPTLVADIHKYYRLGLKTFSEIEQEEQHSNFINWLTGLIPCLRSAPEGYSAFKKGS
jgi:hypothetical protein